MSSPAPEESSDTRRWLTPGVVGVGASSVFSDAGHETASSLLPTFLSSTLGASAAVMALQALSAIAEHLKLPDLAARVEAAAHQATGTSLVVAVLGQFKAGKSSLLNSLVGADLLPVRAIPATSVPTTVRHGATLSATVRYLSGASATIRPGELAEYVTEQHNPDNAKQVERVDVTTSALSDVADLVLTDTPGLGSVHQVDGATETSWLPNVGAALVAISATQPLSAGDIDLIAQLAVHTPHVAVVLTKADLLTDEDLSEVRGFVTYQLRARAGREIPVLAHSVATGYEQLRAAVRSHLRSLEEHRAEAVGTLTTYRVERLVEDCRQLLQLALAVSAADAAARDRLRAALDAERRRLPMIAAEARTLLGPCRSQIEQACVDRLTRRAPVVGSRVRAALRERLGSWRGSLAEETETFRAWLAQVLSDQLEPEATATAEVLAPLVEQGRGPLDRVSQAFTQRLVDHVDRALGITLRPPAIAPPTPVTAPVDVLVGSVFDSHLELLSWAIPMAVFRPAVHHHFIQVAAWESEKNTLRLAYRTSTQAHELLGQLTDGYLDAMAAELTTFSSLIGTLPDDAPVLTRLLYDLDAACDGYVPTSAVTAATTTSNA